MMRFRIVLAAVAASLAVGVVGVPAAGAATTGTIGTVPINGVAKNGKKFTGTYAVQRLVVSGNQAWTVGTLKGRMNGHRVSRAGVKMPASAPSSGALQAPHGPGTCSILHLQLAPIDLNLLGLRVKLGGGPNANQVITLDITAQRGGGLLGDLLCGLSGIIPPLP